VFSKLSEFADHTTLQKAAKYFGVFLSTVTLGFRKKDVDFITQFIRVKPD
jgi:hypothetical protein